ncbi:MAG: type I DNA topoisomerase [Anaplasmataceae bacterium]|nr:type I DNA topoisomerase [Anaplasmataceae bacterium]
MKKLVIVESPTKAKTISKFLGKGYEVESSYGHVRDLPRSALGVDVENNFEPKYVVPRKQQKMVTALKKKAAKAEEVILATDEDREGEAIAWHLTQALKLNPESPVSRIVFHEITEGAIKEALSHPRTLDTHLVNAQQARRVLDRLVGYKLSPFLWKKVVRGLSAGRVQSVAVRLIVEREEEIKAFKPEAYYTIQTILSAPKHPEVEPFPVNLHKVNGETVPSPGFPKKEEVDKVVAQLQTSNFSITDLSSKETRRNPLPPFITSTLQQASSQRLRFTAKKTMFIAQSLYEQGLITYMRTDSFNLSREALGSAKQWIDENLGEDYTTHTPRTFTSSSRLAQEAHEAIRPTNISVTPDSLSLEKDAQKLYDLIWRRFVASQLPPAVFESSTYAIEAIGKDPKEKIELTLSGSVMKFPGFLKIWPTTFEDTLLPALVVGEKLDLKEVLATERFTEPPPRYTEASLIKVLEKNGIGRPSTYAPTISVIQSRNYVTKEQGKFHPTEIGTLVNTVLTEHFPQIVDMNFTASMEESLDEVAEGKKDWRVIIGNFYGPFAENLEKKQEEVKKQMPEEMLDEKCEKCGKQMMIRYGRFGKFKSCSGYPECKNAKPLPKEPPKSTGLKCPKCGEGEIVERRVSRGRARGKLFWGCNRYPKCDHAVWENPLGEKKEKEESSESEDNKKDD